MAGYQQIANNFEQTLVDDGYAVVKLFVHVSKKVQKERLEALRKNPDTAWRVSKRKLAMTEYYDQAYKIYDKFLEGSNFAYAPWTIVNGEDRRLANIQIAQALVDALGHALAAKPDSVADGDKGNTGEAHSEEAKIKAYEEKAAAQSNLAPRGSSYLIMAGYPQIDHSKEKPRIEDADVSKSIPELLESDSKLSTVLSAFDVRCFFKPSNPYSFMSLKALLSAYSALQRSNSVNPITKSRSIIKFSC